MKRQVFCILSLVMLCSASFSWAMNEESNNSPSYPFLITNSNGEQILFDEENYLLYVNNPQARAQFDAIMTDPSPQNQDESGQLISPKGYKLVGLTTLKSSPPPIVKYRSPQQ